ncbi:hypothetical protein F8388_001570 [Cannabis sativa]|uniref:Reverse transcriptase zinc-binding domain-containing protein n=1 Tax=Cannabis sativa TaxID=3483 RepID=A0A7J6HIT9_CANSA|nr:hypothetical protein F8388_001570 [Cannabis sativa]
MTKDTGRRGEGTTMESAEGVQRNVPESVSPTTGDGTTPVEERADERMELMRQKFLEESTMELVDLVSEMEISEEMGRKGALAKCFGKLPLPKNRVKQILNGIWVLRGKWWMKTLEPGLWGIFFELEEDLKQVFEGRSWILGGQVLNLKEWPECGRWQGVDMNLARVWVEIHGLPTPYLAVQNAPVIGAKVGTYVKFDKADPRNLSLNGENDGRAENSGGAEKDTRGPEKGQCLGGEDSTQNRTCRTRNCGDSMECQTARRMVQRSCTNIGDHPMANVEKHPGDDGVILSLMPNVGPSSAQMLEHPHQKTCKSRTPHQHPEPTPVEVEKNMGLETSVALLLGNELDLQRGETISIVSDEDGLQAQIIAGPGQKKRKASIPIIPIDTSGKVINDPGPVIQSNTSLPFSPANSPIFAVGRYDENLSSGKRTKTGSSHGKRKGRPRKDSRSKENPTTGETARTLIQQGTTTIISNGRDINLWWQPWIPWMSYEEFRSTMEEVREKAPHLRYVADLLNQSKTRWNERYVMYLFGRSLGELIIEIDIVNGLDRDKLVWKSVASGSFSVKAAYCLDNEERFGPVLKGWSYVWSNKLHPRMGLWLWRMCSGVLPTRDKIRSGNENECLICNCMPETPKHLFFECHFARGVWFGSPLTVRSGEIQGNTILDMVVNLCKDRDGGSLQKILVCCYVICDGIWKYRNSLLHGGKKVELGRFMDDVNARFEEFVVVQNAYVHDPSDQSKGLLERTPFNSNFIVTDGAFKDGWCGMAMLGNDQREEKWHTRAKSEEGKSALDAELKAIELALEWAAGMNWTSLTIFSDCNVAVEALQQRKLPDWRVAYSFCSVVDKLKVTFAK